MNFEWDSQKSSHNVLKHAVSFEEATQIWEDVHLEIQQLAYAEDGETRSATIGWINKKLYVAIWTKRKSKTRLISVRRARKNEEKIFFEKI